MDYETQYEKCVVASSDRDILVKIYPLIKDLGRCSFVEEGRNQYYIQFIQPFNIRDIINRLSSKAEYPKMKYNIQGNKLNTQDMQKLLSYFSKQYGNNL